jgi:hypothetical protein
MLFTTGPGCTLWPGFLRSPGEKYILLKLQQYILFEAFFRANFALVSRWIGDG